jgi:hypothetical protein
MLTQGYAEAEQLWAIAKKLRHAEEIITLLKSA